MTPPGPKPNPHARRRNQPPIEALAYNRQRAAAALGVSVNHFAEHIAPHLRCVHSGQLRLYPVDELQRWLRESASEPPAEAA